MYAPVEPQTPFDQDFADIYKTHYRRVFGLCRYLLNSFDAGEDATHEVFLRAKRKLAVRRPAWRSFTVDITAKTVTFLADTGWRDIGRRAFKTPILRPSWMIA